MLIVRQKCRLHMLGYYIRSCHIVMCNMCEMWGLFFAHNANIAHVMPCVTAHAVTSFVHRAVLACRQAGHPNYTWLAKNYLWMCHSCRPNDIYQKLTTSHFSTLNVDFANWNMLKRILIAMLNKNKANWDENFRICAEEPIAPLYKW